MEGMLPPPGYVAPAAVLDVSDGALNLDNRHFVPLHQ